MASSDRQLGPQDEIILAPADGGGQEPDARIERLRLGERNFVGDVPPGCRNGRRFRLQDADNDECHMQEGQEGRADMKGRSSRWVLVLLVGTMLLAGCGGSGPVATTVDVQCTDFMENGDLSDQVELAVGDTLTLGLCSNPTTGFQWGPAAISDESVLKEINHRFQAPEEMGTEPVVGTSGEEIWTFETLKAGQATVDLEYSQPWEGGEKGAWTFVLTVMAH
jgi:inhibitor of cysteine peptidase